MVVVGFCVLFFMVSVFISEKFWRGLGCLDVGPDLQSLAGVAKQHTCLFGIGSIRIRVDLELLHCCSPLRHLHRLTDEDIRQLDSRLQPGSEFQYLAGIPQKRLSARRGAHTGNGFVLLFLVHCSNSFLIRP